MSRTVICLVFTALALTGLSGCGSNGAPSSSKSSGPSVADSKPVEPEKNSSSDTEKPRRRVVAPVEITADQTTSSKRNLSASESLDAIRAAIKPFQILLGRWNGTSQKSQTNSSEWAYDWVTDPKQPGLRIKSEKGTYIRDGLLSYLPGAEEFEFKATDNEGTQRIFRGTFTEPIRDVIGDEKKPQRTYKLQLTEPEANASGEQWRITFNQPENNRYILELERKRGKGPFMRVDTVHTQREGTSFALSDTDYGDKICIISQGLGTMSVSYQGQSYWVCCSGCKAAFDEDPQKWIARWEEKKKSMGK